MARYKDFILDEFIASVRDMGDAAMNAAATRIWWAVKFPRTHKMTDADAAIFADWKAEFGA